MSYKYTADELKQIALTILSQISVGTKMACGYRDPSYHARDGHPTLIFRVTIKHGTRHWVNISLMPSDTYTVSLVAVRGTTHKIQEEHTDVYCEDLSELIYRMCNK